MSQILKLLSSPLLERERSVLLQGHLLYSSKGSLDSDGKIHIMKPQGKEWQSHVWTAKGGFQHKAVL